MEDGVFLFSRTDCTGLVSFTVSMMLVGSASSHLQMRPSSHIVSDSPYMCLLQIEWSTRDLE